eukprot:2978702-Amphidinium_carterae.1
MVSSIFVWAWASGCAPLGALSRYILSLGNPKCPQFGSLAAHHLGCKLAGLLGVHRSCLIMINYIHSDTLYTFLGSLVSPVQCDSTDSFKYTDSEMPPQDAQTLAN